MDKVVHFEIPADDVRRANKFYTSVFGWKISKAPVDMEYYMVHTVETNKKGMPQEPGAINGGLMKRMAGEQPVIVINVKSLKDALKKIKDAGGNIVMKEQKVGDFGLYARVTDTEGNIIGVWQDLKK